MAQIGCLGDIVFFVSSRAVKTINNFQWSGSARYGKHQRHLAKTLTEFEGTDADTISFDVMLSAYLGVNPVSEITKIQKYESKGQSLALVIGDKRYGKYRWTIESHKVKAEHYDGEGNLTSATVSINLLEYLRS
ncbi:MAG TPA: phage tail protein [Clostridia bacterium]|nr:phage tail protein [Clostridia bacterium]